MFVLNSSGSYRCRFDLYKITVQFKKSVAIWHLAGVAIAWVHLTERIVNSRQAMLILLESTFQISDPEAQQCYELDAPNWAAEIWKCLDYDNH